MDSNEKAYRGIMDDLQLMMRDRKMDPGIQHRMRVFFTSNKMAQQRAQHRHILESLSPGLQGEVMMHLNREWIASVSILKPILKRARQSDGGPPRAFLADIAKVLNPAVFSQSECFGAPHVLYILNCGLVSREWRLYHSGAVWGVDFVLADPELVLTINSF